MIEDIVLNTFPKESGVYLFKANDEVIYVGSSKNLYHRMSVHNTAIKKGSEHGYKQDLYQYLQTNTFAVEFQLTDNYRQLEQQLIEQHHPKYNSHRAFTGLNAYKGREAEYNKEHYWKYKEEILEQVKQYYESHKQQKIKNQKKYGNQLCFYNGQTLTLNALRLRFRKAGLSNPTAEAKKYLKDTNPIEFYDVYP